VISPEVADGVTIVRIDHPPVNALDLDLLEAIIATMRNVEGPVVITGGGRCFSAGVDLRALVDGGAGYAERFVTALSEAFLAVFDHPAPVVAAINGHAIAGGCVFAMCADVRLMSAGTIGLTELAVGVPFPVAALEICRFAMGPSVVRAALRANTIDADTALAQGWIDALVPSDDLIPQATAIAVLPGCVRGHQATATPAGSRRDRCGRGSGYQGSGELDDGGDPRPHCRICRGACPRPLIQRLS
jgi:enoyl-CoA hydratase